MLCFDLNYPTPEENLACDEALLDWCEDGVGSDLIRFWEPASNFVVVGYGNQVAREVNLKFCELNSIPVLRRCSGGGTVLQAPGCLNYTLVLRVTASGPLQSIASTNLFILEKHQAVLASLLRAPVERQGHTDLAIGGLKFSGNAQRRRKDFLLFHGCLLLDADIPLIEQVLPLPSKQPQYRANRAHSDFLLNLKVPAAKVKTALATAWDAHEIAPPPPMDRIALLVQEKYSGAEWNYRT